MLNAAIQWDWSTFVDQFTHPGADFTRALWTTVYVSVAAQVFGTALGVLSALGGMSKWWGWRGLSGAYTLLFRGTPVIVQIYFVYYGVNLFLGINLFPREADILGMTIPGAALAGIVALSLNEGAYMSEIVRAGIYAIPPGQMEAALATGMRRGMAMRRIVLPQAARVIVPGLGNEFNNMLKTSSLLSFIGAYELFQNTQIANSTLFKPTELYAAVAVWYLLLTTVWTMIQIQIERKLGASDRLDNERWYQRILGSGRGPYVPA